MRRRGLSGVRGLGHGASALVMAEAEVRKLEGEVQDEVAAGNRVTDPDELERAHILKVLELCEGQKTKAAQMLGINRTTLWKKLRQYGLEAD